MLKIIPRFIVFDGPDCSGKTSAIPEIAKYIENKAQREVVICSDPGSTQTGLELRMLLKGKLPMAPNVQMLLFTAARTQLIEEFVLPETSKGKVVLCDRFIASTLIYQIYAQRTIEILKAEGHDESTFESFIEMDARLDTHIYNNDLLSEMQQVLRLHSLVCGFVPQINFIFNISADTFNKRRANDHTRTDDRFEGVSKEKIAFQAAVRLGYKNLVDFDPYAECLGGGNVIRIDANASKEDTLEQIQKHLMPIREEPVKYFFPNID